ncbi:uncharacterized protein LOC116939324 isoform X3 [Petromyzon marinus]|uniref:uncharacterized protein LOC116939324 isoform X3 n=1 Tax=Petromyzon marinus TaxID=7757 RepID=UPI003F71EAF9
MEGDCSQQQQQELLVKALARTVAGGRSLLGGAQAESGEAGELQEFVLQKITSLGGMIREYAQLMSSVLVSSRADLEQLWRLHLGKSDVREAVEELLQLEEEWSSFLKGMDERLDIEVTAPGVAEPAVQLPLDLELTDARCGRCLSQRCWVRTLHPCCSCCFVISPDCPDAIMSPGSSLTRCAVGAGQKVTTTNTKGVQSRGKGDLAARVVLVSFSSCSRAKAWLNETGATFPMLLDPNRRLFTVLGLRVSVSRVWSVATLIYYAEQIVAGRSLLQTAEGPPEDLNQLGGDFLVGESGRVLWSRPSHSPMDRPGLQDIQEALHAR